MLTTLAIDNDLLKAAKRHARQRGLTIDQLVEEALRAAVARNAGHAEHPPIPVFTGGTGLRPGIDATSNRGLFEALDTDPPIEPFR